MSAAGTPEGLLHPLEIEWDQTLRGGSPLDWPGYPSSSAGDSVVTGRCAVGRTRYVVIAGRFGVMGGSMGVVHGERVVRAYRRAALEKLPVVVLANSGGARLQEGMAALTQMARTAGAARAHARSGLLSIAVLRSPTMGGVFASYASLADLSAAEPGAAVGFAGPRVVETVTGTPVPLDSHTAESAFDAGLVDALVSRPDQPAWVELVLGIRQQRLEPRALPAVSPVPGSDGAWQAVVHARWRGRPTGIDHAARLCDSWVELRGTDPTLRAGLARINRDGLVVIAHDRYAGNGRQTPEAFELAQRALGLADRLRLPVLTLIDTPGAEPAPESERAGVARGIANTLALMAEVRVPTVAVCVGEGGSGGAMALAGADRLLMLSRSVFSVISPEAAAAILARDASQAAEYAERLKLTAEDLVAMGIADTAVDEGDTTTIDQAILSALGQARAGDRARRLDAATAHWLR